MMMSRLFLLTLLLLDSSVQSVDLAPHDPLALKKHWRPDLLEECSAIGFDDQQDLFSHQCEDTPRIATCYLARRLSTLNDCEQAGSFLDDNTGLCSLFPDAYRNYCCQTAPQMDTCPAAAEAENASANAQAVSLDHYFPESSAEGETPPRRLQRSDLVKIGEKYLVIAFPHRMTPCTLMQTGWRLLRVLALFFDTNEMLNILQESPAKMLARQQWQAFLNSKTFYPELNIALETPTGVQDLLTRIRTSVPSGTRYSEKGRGGSRSTREVFISSLPSTGLLKNDTDRRFIDQFGQPEALPANVLPQNEKNESSEPLNERDLRRSAAFGESASEECATKIPRLDDAFLPLFADYFSGQTTATELADKVGAFIDKAVVFINGTEAQVDFKKLYNTNRFSGLVTPTFMLIPPCVPGPLNTTVSTDELSRIALRIPTMLRQSASNAKILLAQLDKCGDCFERAWRYIVLKANERSNSEDVPSNEQTMQEGRRIQRSVMRYLEQLVALEEVTESDDLPKSLGELVTWVIKSLTDVPPETIGEASSLLEAVLLFIDAVQRDSASGGGLDVQLEVTKFIRDNFDCPMTKTPSNPEPQPETAAPQARSLLRNLADTNIEDLLSEEFEDAADYRRLAGRIRRQQEVPGMNVVGSGTFKNPVVVEGEIPSIRENEEDTTIDFHQSPPTPAPGNLPLSDPREENQNPANDHPPMSGYQCRDDFPGLYSDFLSIWLKKAQCFDLIEFFGCMSDRLPPASSHLLPWPILLNACPETWLSQCRSHIPSSRFIDIVQKPDTDPNSVKLNSTHDEQQAQPIDSDDEYSAFLSHMPNNGPLLPLKHCLQNNTYPHVEPETDITNQTWHQGPEEPVQSFEQRDSDVDAETPEVLKKKTTKSQPSMIQSWWILSISIMYIFHFM